MCEGSRMVIEIPEITNHAEQGLQLARDIQRLDGGKGFQIDHLSGFPLFAH